MKAKAKTKHGHKHGKHDKGRKLDTPVSRVPEDDMPAAGPHAKPHLNVPERTPGAGSLPDLKRPAEGDATTG